MHRLRPVVLAGLLFVSGHPATGLGQEGSLDPTFTPPADLDSEVYCTAVQPDGRILVGGRLRNIGGIGSLDNLVRLNANGSLDTTFTPPPFGGFNDSVHSIALQPDGKILVGGRLGNIGGSPTLEHLIRLETNGSRDVSFTPPPFDGVFDAIFSIALQPDGRILVGGILESIGGVATLNHLTRLDADGSRDTTFTPPPFDGFYDFVDTIAIQPDGHILVGGFLEDIGGVGTLDHLVRLEVNGSLDTSFTPPVDLSGSVASILLQTDGQVLVGGIFDNVGDVETLDKLARLNANGSLDLSFTPPAGLNGGVRSTALQADGKILVGGSFIDAGGVTALDYLARLNPGGAIDSTFTPAPVNNPMNSIDLQADGRILVGGFFTDVGGAATLDKLVRLENAPASGSLALEQTSVTWTRGGTAPEASRVTFELSTDRGATYRPIGEASRISDGWRRTGFTLPLTGILRARAFIQNGGTGSGIVEILGRIDSPTPPLLTLRGKSNLTTSKVSITLRGTAEDPDGDLVSVLYKDSGRKWRKARGTARWTANASLKPGRNIIQIRAYDSRNAGSTVKRVTVIRK